jgi:leucyl/phenylalanyl-tRNA--protein transferase
LIFELSSELLFPPAHLAEEDGLLAVGGDLSSERLLLAYISGIFPWYSEGDPILWHSPDPRFVLFPHRLIVSHSMQKLMKTNRYHITFNTCFDEVIQHCSKVKRKDQEGTWIIDEMIKAYRALHEKGFAISVEVWNEKEVLVGGLYGVKLGRFFAGESMFSLESNTSKLALIETIRQLDVAMIDCQVYTSHLASLGAEMIKRDEYLKILDDLVGMAPR